MGTARTAEREVEASGVEDGVVSAWLRTLEKESAMAAATKGESTEGLVIERRKVCLFSHDDFGFALRVGLLY